MANKLDPWKIGKHSSVHQPWKRGNHIKIQINAAEFDRYVAIMKRTSAVVPANYIIRPPLAKPLKHNNLRSKHGK